MTPLGPPPPYTPNDPNAPGVSAPNLTVQPTLVVPPVALTPTDGDPRASPALQSDAALTPPASPNHAALQLNDVGVEDPMFSASRAYFESRPALMQLPPQVHSHDLIITEDTTPEDLQYPQPEHTWLARDVTEQDWFTLRNYLFPLAQMAANAQIIERKMQAELEWREGGNQDSAGIQQLENVHLSPPQPGLTSQPRGLDEKSSRAPPIEPENERSERIKSTLAEWNEGFFQPRGLNVTATMIPYSRPPPSPTASSVTMVPATPTSVAPDSSDDGDIPESSTARLETPEESQAQPDPARRVSSETATLHSPTVEEDPASAFRSTLAKFLLSSRNDPEGALNDLSNELRSQKTINLREVKKELHLVKEDMYRDWKAAIEEHKQNSKVMKNMKKAEWEQKKIEWDRKKQERKERNCEHHRRRKSEEWAEKKQRREEKRQAKHEQRTLKKELKAERRRQMKEFAFGCPRRDSNGPAAQSSSTV